MYGETATMRRRVNQLRDQATDLRAMADHLVGQVAATAWPGRAGRDLRTRVEDRAAHLRETAGAHDTAADTLARHVTEVDRLKESIAEIERRAARAVDAGQPLDRFVPPGHKDWLTMNLQGR